MSCRHPFRVVLFAIYCAALQAICISVYGEVDDTEIARLRSPAVYFEGQAILAAASAKRKRTGNKAAEISSAEPEYIRDTADNWKKKKLLVCFLDARPVSVKVVEIASKWNSIANVSLDFGDRSNPRLCDLKTPADIRISYQSWPPRGQWSLIGIKSTERKNQAAPTMNLKYYDGVYGDPPTEPYFTWIILHEFGHALGFQHEYKNPVGGCDDQFNWEIIYGKWGSKDEADAQLRQLPDSSAYDFSTYDAQSVMRYYYPEDYFVNGKSSTCYGEPVLVISPTDKLGLLAAYPFKSRHIDR